MVFRVAFLCSKKTDAVTNLAEEIAMVTFTNDAANNMKVRLVEEVDRAHISTIHRFAFDILRGEALYTGLGINFHIALDAYLRGKIYDMILLQQVLDECSEKLRSLKSRHLFIDEFQDTLLVSLMRVNNEMGVIQPVEELGAELEKREILFRVDATQSCGMHVKKLRSELRPHSHGRPRGAD